MQTFLQTILSQYQSSPRLMGLLRALDAWLSPDANYELFYTTVWNIETASGYGLDVLGRIVNIPRTVSLSGVPTFGFGEAGDRVGFGQGPFFEASLGISQNFTLVDDVYRSLILAKAAYNITNGSVEAINALLMNLFAGRGNCWVTDGRNIAPYQTFGFTEAGDREGFGHGSFEDLVFSSGLPNNMTLTYTFAFPLQPFEEAIVRSGVLPKPTGVTPFWSFLVGTVGPPSQTYLSNDGGVLVVLAGAFYPSSAVGLAPGALWSNTSVLGGPGVVTVVPGITPNPSAPPVYFGVTSVALLALGGGNLPLTNPGVMGRLWNNGGVVCVS